MNGEGSRSLAAVTTHLLTYSSLSLSPDHSTPGANRTACLKPLGLADVDHGPATEGHTEHELLKLSWAWSGHTG